jgi:hypothetical protein
VGSEVYSSPAVSDVFIGQTRIGSEGGWNGLAQLLRSPSGVVVPTPVLRSFEPNVINDLVQARIESANKMVRVWAPEGKEQIIRGIVSTGYEAKSAQSQVDQLLNRMHDQEVDGLRIANYNENPDSWSAEIVDIDHPIDFRIPGDSVLVDGSLAGFKMRANDVGSGAAIIDSYLYRIVCENGLISVLGQARMRAIHRGAGDWSGNLFTGADWLDLLTQAGSEVFEAGADTTEVFNRLKALANRPPLQAVRQSLDEALKLTSPGEGISRWALAQGAAAAANSAKGPEARQDLQRWAGRILSESVSEVLPTLESMLVT